jgi:hypothetical protein
MNTTALRTNWLTALMVGLAIIGAPLMGVLVSSHGLEIFAWLALGIAFFVVLVHPRVGLYAMLFLVPTQNLVVFQGGSTLVRFVGMGVAGAWILSKLVRKEPIRPLLTGPLVTPMLVFLYLAGISVLWSEFTTWRVAIFSLVQLVVWVFILIDLIDSPKRLRIALFFLLLGCMVSAGMIVYDFVSFSGSTSLIYRPEGGHGDPNYSSSTFLVILPFAMHLIRNRSGWQWLMGIAVIAFLVLSIGFTISRTALLLTAVVFAFQLILFPDENRGKLKYLFIGALVFLVIAPLLPWQQIEARFSEAWTGDVNVDFGGRWRLAGIGLQRFMWNPILGRGFGKIERNFTCYHNLLIQMMVELGIPGLLSMVWIWVVSWRSLSRARRDASMLGDMDLLSLVSALQLSFVVYFVFSLTVSNDHIRTLWLIFALAEIGHRLVVKARVVREGEALPAEARSVSESLVNRMLQLPVEVGRMGRPSV